MTENKCKAVRVFICGSLADDNDSECKHAYDTESYGYCVLGGAGSKCHSEKAQAEALAELEGEND